MRRVYAIWALRQIFSPFSMKLLILLGVMKQSANLIFVRSVLHNAPSPFDPMANIQFFGGAFFHTNIIVKLLLILTLALSAWLLRDIVLRPRLQLAYYK